MKLSSAILAFALLVPAGDTLLPKVDLKPWDEILHQYVDQQHLVDYTKLKQQDSKKLHEFVASGPCPNATKPISDADYTSTTQAKRTAGTWRI